MVIRAHSENKRIHILIFCFILSLIMGLSFFFQADKAFQRDSDRFVTGMIAAGSLSVDLSQTQFGLNVFSVDGVEYFGDKDADYEDSTLYFLYNSQNFREGDVQITYTRTQQIGTQGWIAYMLGILGAKFSVSGRICFLLLRAVNAMLLALVLVAVSYELKKAYNLLFAVSFYAVSFCANWLVNFSVSSYWAAFSWFVPMWLGLLCLNHPKKRFLIYPCLIAAVAFKSSCGYEYIPNIMLSAVLFLVIEFVFSIKKDISKAKLLLKTTIGVGISCMIGFMVVFILNCYMRGDGNLSLGFNDFYINDIQRRTFGNAESFGSEYANSLNATIFDVLIKYFLLTPTGWLVIFLLGVNIYLFVRLKKEACVPHNCVLLAASLICAVSWLVLAKSHSYMHTHINPVLFYLPYIQTAVYLAVKNGMKLFFETHSEGQTDALVKAKVSQFRAFLANCN